MNSQKNISKWFNILTLILITTISPKLTKAQFSGGDGSSSNPYQISNATELDNIRNYLTSSFILTADIDLNVAPFNSGSGWEPIGGFNTGYRFEGSIDGDGYTISNLYINRSGVDNIGLISATNYGSVHNLKLLNVNVTGDGNTGALIGFSGGTAVSFVQVSGTVTGDGATAGLLGYIFTGSVSNSSVAVTVNSSSNHIGGLTGILHQGSVTDSYSTGSVNGVQRVGGLVGMLSGGTVTRSYATGHVSGTSSVGGLIGYNYSGSTNNSFWDTQTSNQSSSAGGEVGKTTSEMKNQATFTSAGWNFGVVWNMNSGSNNGYPTLLPPSVFDNGLGTSGDPFHVGSAAQLNEVRNYLSAYFIQTEHIDLSSISNWDPIENFEGSFDGNGRIISNLTINRPSEDNVGLFEIVLEGAVLNRIALENANITGRNYVGTIAGTIYDDVTNSYSSGSVTALNHAGGLVGRIQQTKAASIGLERTYSIANVTATASSAGGLAGRFYDGHIRESYAVGLVTAPSAAGGLVGEYNPSSNYITSNSYWNTETTSQTSNSGGGTAINTSQMLQQSTFTGWNFTSDWDIKERDTDGSLSYPYLKDPLPITIPGQVTNTAPFATNIYINGKHMPGESLVGEYDFFDTDGDEETGTTFRWYRYNDANGSGKTIITGVTGRVYTVNQYDDADKYISFEVTPGDEFGQGNIFESSLIGPQPEEPVYGVFDAGAGTLANPYQIATPQQLDQIRNYPSFYFILTANIDLNVAPYNTGSGWDPIGTQSNPFTGTLFGDGHIIDGLFINTTDTYVGLFGNTKNANIYQVGVTNVNITGEDFVAALVGFQSVDPSNESLIEDCYATGTVNSTYSEGGGLIGRMQASGGTNTIRNSYSTVQVNGTNVAGGFVGRMSGSGSSSTNRIYNSYSTGAVSGSVSIGGFVGNRIGGGNNSTFTSFWDTQTSGQSSSDGGIGETTANMKTQSTFASYNWDFQNKWAISSGTNNGYPAHQTQSPTPVFPGSGTIQDPYQISTADQLNAVRNYKNANFMLIGNIDLNTAPYNTGQGWEPIGDELNPFNGRFDGNDYAITGLFINRSTNYVGLFGRTSNAQLTNIRLTQVQITGNNYTGGLVGQQSATSRTSTIANSYVSGTIDGNNYVGLFAGAQYGAAGANYIQNSYAIGTVENAVRSGGLVGAQIAEAGGLNNISVSYAASNVKGSIESGGLLGYVEVISSGTNSVDNSFWDENASGQTQSEGGLAKSTSQMKTQTTFTSIGWDFSTRWSISSGINSGYPTLQKDPIFAGGDGSSGNPFKISNANQLNEIRNYLSSHFVLTNNIDVGNFGYNYPEGWNPIGENSSGYEFRGVFDGNGYLIQNLRIRRKNQHVVGLFGAIFNGEVKNVGLTDVEIEGNNIVGALVGISYSDAIQTFATGTVKGANHVGGLVGILEDYNGSTAEITESFAVVNVEASGANAGGLVGRMISGAIDETYAAGQVTGTGSNIGGLVGLHSTGTAVKSYWDVEASNLTVSPLGIGKTSDEMKSQEIFTNWDFSSIWTLQKGAKISYPYLQNVVPNKVPGEEKTYENGAGTSADPFQISSAKELNRVRLNKDSVFVQTANIDLSIFPNWEPILNFGGTYNGGGYSISNLTINRPSSYNNGLFGSSNGTILRVGLDSVSIIGATNTAALVGFMSGGSISESYSTGSVSGGSYAGGLVGQLLWATISNSYSTASVDGQVNTHIGGLVGIRNNATITNSYSTGLVTGTGTRTLGFVGYRTGSGNAAGNYWDEETSGKTDSYDATGLSSQDMKAQSSFSGWDFGSVWAIKTGYEKSYPYLRNNTPDELPGYIDLIGYDGEGTEANPYKINTPLQLHAIRFNLNSHFELIDDIDMNIAPYNSGQGWEPIGTNSRGSEFQGILDGNGYTIKNLFINRPSTDFVGFLGATYQAVVKNIAFEQANVTGRDYTGILVGINYSDLVSSYSTGSVTGRNHVGGLVGALENYGGDAHLNNSFSTAIVTASGNHLGGLIGRMISGYVQSTFSAGQVLGDGDDHGGLIGVYQTGSVTNSYWDVEVSGQLTSASGTGLTTAQMWESSNLSGFNWTEKWAKADSISYPYLREFGHKKTVIFGTEGWRFMTAPSGKHTIASMLDEVWLQGFTGANAPSASPNILFWNEATKSWQIPNNITDSLEVGTGFVIYMYSDQNGPEVIGDAGFPKIITNNLPQFRGKVTNTLSYTDSGTPLNDGWNLIGNPYRKSINWDATNGWSRTNIDAPFYIWSSKDRTYKSWNGISGTLQNGKIAPWQSIWVKANAASPVVSFSDSVSSSGGVFEKKKPVPQIKLSLSNNENTSETVVLFHTSAMPTKDKLDAYKLLPLTTSFLSLGTSLNDEPTMDIQALPIKNGAFELDLDIDGSNVMGEHTLIWNVSAIPDEWSILLRDHKNETSYNLDSNDTLQIKLAQPIDKKYSSTNSNPTSPIQLIGKKKEAITRFQLIIRQSQTVDVESNTEIPNVVELQQNYPNPFNPSTTIAYGVPKTGEVTLEVFDVLGRKVATLLDKKHSNAGRHTIQFNASNLASGIYIYRLISNNTIITKKLMLIK